MKKILFVLLIMLLVACGGSAPEEAAVSQETAVPDQAAADPTAAPAAAPTDAPTPTTAPTEVVEEEATVEEETAVDTAAQPFEELLADASAVRADDWSQGTSEPLITIIEYGDFQ
ncbi:MAG: hypothetical protein KDE56_20635 [Anaerolineales bacterium]|nr:hypothetical protein [Anaerolineales bacterium]